MGHEQLLGRPAQEEGGDHHQDQFQNLAEVIIEDPAENMNPSNFESTFFLARAWGAATPVLSPGAENKSLTVILYYCLAYRVFYCLVYCVFNCLVYCVFHCVLYCDLLIDDLFIICTCSALGKGAEKKPPKKCGLLPNRGGSRRVVKCQTSILGS